MYLHLAVGAGAANDAAEVVVADGVVREPAGRRAVLRRVTRAKHLDRGAVTDDDEVSLRLIVPLIAPLIVLSIGSRRSSHKTTAAAHLVLRETSEIMLNSKRLLRELSGTPPPFGTKSTGINHGNTSQHRIPWTMNHATVAEYSRAAL